MTGQSYERINIFYNQYLTDLICGRGIKTKKDNLSFYKILIIASFVPFFVVYGSESHSRK